MEELKKSTKKGPSLVFHGEVILSQKTQSMFLQIQLLLALPKRKKKIHLAEVIMLAQYHF